ncbi:hypothetical protein KY359_06720 [Candidatus Woesearchaeota archaeon]|nr:hypothetical protein [Candidatus Woesearchaeota archaeon]
MGLTNIILALAAAYATAGAPAGQAKHDSYPPDDWRSMYDQAELAKCEQSNATSDCTLLLDPDQDFLKGRCGGYFPYAYEVRAGDEKDPEPEILVFCSRQEYEGAIARGELRDYSFLDFAFPDI